MKGDRLLRERLRERVAVTLTSGEAFEGLLAEWDERLLVLVQARQVAGFEGRPLPDGQPVRVDGHLLLPWPQVVYIQKP